MKGEGLCLNGVEPCSPTQFQGGIEVFVGG